eukprot:GHVQ01024483.1.p1 GENE.GHVQ01024483.1~~GHVQ01024483.1.p1  ORF type:complete len:700 (+),score=100.71 GHVQ01024483.1:426-2525(+)
MPPTHTQNRLLLSLYPRRWLTLCSSARQVVHTLLPQSVGQRLPLSVLCYSASAIELPSSDCSPSNHHHCGPCTVHTSASRALSTHITESLTAAAATANFGSVAASIPTAGNQGSSVPSPVVPFVYEALYPSAQPADIEFERIDDLSELVRTINLQPTVSPSHIPPTPLTDSSSTSSTASLPLTFTVIPPSLLSEITRRSFTNINHFLRPSHLAQLRQILDDKEATDNDRFVASQLLKNANIAAAGVLPGCQDTGTAIVTAKKGDRVIVCEGEIVGDGGRRVGDEECVARGVYDAYTQGNLRYSQVSPLDMFSEVNTKCNLPAQIDIYSKPGNGYELMCIAKGGGSANKTFLYQQTKSVLNDKSLYKFLQDHVKTIGTSACPPYHLAIVIGGLSAEMTLKTVKLASCRYLDNLPTKGSPFGGAFRDLEWEQKVLKMTQDLGIGAQFGGKYFCHDVRVVRLPRHGASCPIGIGVSCSADRQQLSRIVPDGVYMEKLETNPSRFMPDVTEEELGGVEPVRIDMRSSGKIDEVVAELSKLQMSTRVLLTGSLIVMRDIAHARIYEQLVDTGKLPEYVINHPIYYAGPAKTPKGLSSGSFGPTTAGRMDSYIEPFMKAGGSRITLAKGNRSKQVVNACKKYGGFYLGSIGGPAALLATNCIKNVRVIDFEELGMEAVWKIEVEDFPAFIVVDNKGHDFYQKWLG